MFLLTLHQMSSYGGHCESNMPSLSILSVSLEHESAGFKMYLFYPNLVNHSGLAIL